MFVREWMCMNVRWSERERITRKVYVGERG